MVDAKARRYRKQILPLTTINYEGRKIKFDKEYLTELVRSFKDGAVHQVPWQIADAKNSHNNDPERTRGMFVDLELTSDGLYGVAELSERGEQIVKDNPELGVSARILENVERATDGKVFPRVLQHVLGTVDSKIPGMRPWEAVALSNDESVTETLDLSAENYPEEDMADTKTKVAEDKKVTVELSEADHTALLELLADQKIAAELANEVGDEDETEDEGDEPKPKDDTGAGGEKSASLSAEHLAAIELARTEAQVARTQATELTNQLRDAEVEREMDRYRSTGLAPSILDLARETLALPPQAIELSNGKKTDPGKNMRAVLNEVISLAQTGHDMIDLDRESGVIVGTDSVQENRAAAVAAWREQDGDED